MTGIDKSMLYEDSLVFCENRCRQTDVHERFNEHLSAVGSANSWASRERMATKKANVALNDSPDTKYIKEDLQDYGRCAQDT